VSCSASSSGQTSSCGPLFPEFVQVVADPVGEPVKVIAKGLRTSQVHESVLSADQLGRLEPSLENLSIKASNVAAMKQQDLEEVSCQFNSPLVAFNVCV
jgi:hypothetical protein